MALLVFLLLIQLVSVSGRRCPDGQIKHRLCCVPVWNCNEGHYVKKCERDGAEDECLKCPRGTNNPFNSSSFDIKHCYKSICKLSDSVAVSDTDCECDRSKGWFGENYLACQLKHGGCPPGKELTQKGKCERCTNFHYKDWHGLGFCKKHFDCEHLNMDEIMGNAVEPNKCIKKGIPIRVKPASGENKRPVELVTTTTSSSSPSPSLYTTTKTKSTTQKNKETTSKVTQKTTPSERDFILKHVSVSPTKVSQNLPVVGNRDPTNIEATRNGRIEGILIVVVAILCFLLLLIFCIGTVAYIRRRLKSSPEVTIPNRPALPLPNDQPVQQVADTFAPPIYQSQRQTQPLLQPENPYLCMSGPNQSCIYALPASLHLSSAQNVNCSYRPPAFDNISTYGSQYVPSQIRPAPAASPNSLGSQLTLQPRSEHLYMTLPAERSENDLMPSALTLSPQPPPPPPPPVPTAQLQQQQQQSFNLETENFYEFP